MHNNGVVAHMRGGIGNQLFIFAAAYSQARRLDVPLFLDTADFKEVNIRNFELGTIDFTKSPIPISVIDSSGFKGLRNTAVGRASIRLVQSRNAFADSPAYFDNSINQITPGTRLTGYFQSFRYFENYVGEVIGFLEQINPVQPGDSRENGIALQIRLGDYLTEKNLPLYGICSENYYLQAAGVLESLLGMGPRTVYSDTPEQVTSRYANLLRVNATHLSQYSGSPMSELNRIASHAGAVISNSTFGWWAAFIGKYRNTNFQVIAPRPWTLSITSSRDLLPHSWLTLDNRG